jgi:hypothetical protein
LPRDEEPSFFKGFTGNGCGHCPPYIAVFETGLSTVSRTNYFTSEQFSFPEENVIKLKDVNVFSSHQGVSQNSSTQVSLEQIGFSQNSSGQIGIFQIGLPQVGFTQNGTTQLHREEISTSQNNFSQINIFQIWPTSITIGTQINSTEIPLSSSLSPQQFFSIHNTSPTSIYDIINYRTNYVELISPNHHTPDCSRH